MLKGYACELRKGNKGACRRYIRVRACERETTWGNWVIGDFVSWDGDLDHCVGALGGVIRRWVILCHGMVIWITVLRRGVSTHV